MSLRVRLLAGNKGDAYIPSKQKEATTRKWVELRGVFFLGSLYPDQF